MTASLSPKEWLGFLRCPFSGEKLVWLGKARLAKLNAAIKQDDVVSHGGAKIADPVVSGLYHRGSARVYPCYNSVVLLNQDDVLDVTGIL